MLNGWQACELRGACSRRPQPCTPYPSLTVPGWQTATQKHACNGERPCCRRWCPSRWPQAVLGWQRSAQDGPAAASPCCGQAHPRASHPGLAVPITDRGRGPTYTERSVSSLPCRATLVNSATPAGSWNSSAGWACRGKRRGCRCCHGRVPITALEAGLRGTWSHWSASAAGGAGLAGSSTLRPMRRSPLHPGGRLAQLVAQLPASRPGQYPPAMSVKLAHSRCRQKGQRHGMTALTGAAHPSWSPQTAGLACSAAALCSMRSIFQERRCTCQVPRPAAAMQGMARTQADLLRRWLPCSPACRATKTQKSQAALWDLYCSSIVLQAQSMACQQNAAEGSNNRLPQVCTSEEWVEASEC